MQTLNDQREDMHKKPNTTWEVTRNSEAVCTSITQQPHTYLKILNNFWRYQWTAMGKIRLK